MRYLLLTLLLVVTGCESQPNQPMKGEPVKLKADAYTDMCLREPSSPLCTTAELKTTNATDLNQRLCEICAKDNSYSFCKFNKHCADYVYTPKQEPKPEPEKGETMQGEPVRIRAQAYEDLCKREPESVLCKE